MSTNITMSMFLDWERTTRDTIDLKRIYVDMAGDLVAGIVLSQIVFWSLPDKNGQTKLRVKKDGHLWIAKQRADWWEECRVSTKQLDRALAVLIGKRLIHKSVTLFDNLRTVIVRLNDDQPPANYASTPEEERQPFNFISTWMAFSDGRGEHRNYPLEHRNCPSGSFVTSHRDSVNSPKGTTLNRDYAENTTEMSCANAQGVPPFDATYVASQDGTPPGGPLGPNPKKRSVRPEGPHVTERSPDPEKTTREKSKVPGGAPANSAADFEDGPPEGECESAWGYDGDEAWDVGEGPDYTTEAECEIDQRGKVVLSPSALKVAEPEGTGAVKPRKRGKAVDTGGAPPLAPDAAPAVTGKAIQGLVMAYQAAVGAKLPATSWGKESKFAKEMLVAGYSREDVMACYQHMKTDKFWRDKPLSLASVASKIADWKARELGRIAVAAERAAGRPVAVSRPYVPGPVRRIDPDTGGVVAKAAPEEEWPTFRAEDGWQVGQGGIHFRITPAEPVVYEM